MRHEYEFRYHYGVSPHPAIERADMTDDSQAAVRAVRELLCMPSRHAVEVWRDGVVIFWRSRIRPWPADPASSVETQHIGGQSLQQIDARSSAQMSDLDPAKPFDGGPSGCSPSQ